MSDTCETVVIETENGPVVINKSDFDPKSHKLAGQKDDVKSSKKATKKTK